MDRRPLGVPDDYEPLESDGLLYSDENRPRKGKKFTVLDSDKKNGQIEKAKHFVGKQGTVQAYWGPLGVDLHFPNGESGCVPYEMLEQNPRKK